MSGGTMDKEVVRAAAAGRWTEIVQRLSPIDHELLDHRREHPCPKCGGKTRFRVFDNFAETGGAYCNHCFNRQNGDGFAFICWMTGESFNDVVRKVGDLLGIAPQPSKGKGSVPRDCASQLEFQEWNRDLVTLWCLHFPPITVDALESLGARLAQYRCQGKHHVIAIPGHDQSGKIVSWTVMNLSGGTLPAGPEQLKTKVTKGSKSSIIGDQSGEVVWKVEGPKDLLALLSIGLPANHSVFTNANGATENPKKWMVEPLAGKLFSVVPDADQPGVNGADKWASAAAHFAADVRRVLLPYAVQEKHGNDLRDWLNEGNDYRGLLQMAKASAKVERNNVVEFSESPAEEWINEKVDDPHRLARFNLESYRKQHGKELVYWNQSWYRWEKGRYCELSSDYVESCLNGAIRKAFEIDWHERKERYDAWRQSDKYDPEKDKGEPEIRSVTGAILSNAFKAMKSLCQLSSKQKLETWIEEEAEGQFISVGNGILNFTRLANHETTDVLIPHSPKWFSLNKLSCDFDSQADCPRWKAFLDDVFNGDRESIDALKMWFGYLLCNDKSLHKIMFIIGQTRSGKGTIMRVLKEILGEHSIATPTLTELGTSFGLQSLIGKTSAIITDARISNRVDESAVTERLLSISGDDPQNVQRKYLTTLAGHELHVRFTLFSNLLPMLKDASSAFISRCLFLSMPNCYLGREDRGLGNALRAEMSGILNWAIHGKLMLDDRGEIRQPETGRGLLSEMKSIISPVLEFIEERCEIGGECECQTRELYSEWEQWCADNDIANAGSIQAFSRKLKAIHPTVDTAQIRFGASRTRFFVGLRLKNTESEF